MNYGTDDSVAADSAGIIRFVCSAIQNLRAAGAGEEACKPLFMALCNAAKLFLESAKSINCHRKTKWVRDIPMILYAQPERCDDVLKIVLFNDLHEFSRN